MRRHGLLQLDLSLNLGLGLGLFDERIGMDRLELGLSYCHSRLSHASACCSVDGSLQPRRILLVLHGHSELLLGRCASLLDCQLTLLHVCLGPGPRLCSSPSLRLGP